MIGIGWDLHRLERGKKLILGGIEIQSDFGAVAHSDGDVLLHALTDALLGAAGLGDIGELFPDTKEEFEGRESSYFVKEALKLTEEHNLKIVNIDSVIKLESPKILRYKESIKESIAGLCGINPGRVGVKAKTSEKTGPCGRSEAIEAYCVVQLDEYENNG